jgi:transglutaminase/protease-like cytokinesis protein 3
MIRTLNLIFLFFLFCHAVYAGEYQKADAVALKTKGIAEPALLSRKLTASLNSDREKARAIFRWLTENIAYDTEQYHTPDSLKINVAIFSTSLQDPKKESYEMLMAKEVIKRGKAICSGYANLYKVLCDSAGLKCEVVNGKAKNSVNDVGRPMDINHAWNVIWLDKKWNIVDATWAAGSCDSSVRTFTRSFCEAWWLPNPSKAAFSHYPADPKFALCKLPAETDFYSYPQVHTGFLTAGISSFSPQKGAIEARPGSKVMIELRLPVTGTYVSANTNTGNDQLVKKREEKIVSYEYTVTSDKDDELIIYHEGEAILSYRLYSTPAPQP